jgi:hypothetical protein
VTACTLEEIEIDEYIRATPVVSGITVSASVTAYADSPAHNITAISTTPNGFYITDALSDVLNVDADINGNLQSDAGEATLIVGIPAYGGQAWDSEDDTLVIEDVILDGVAYTLHFKIPQFVTADTDETTNTALQTDPTLARTLPEMFVYRKVSLATTDLMPSDNTDVCSARNVRTGNLVEDSYDPTGLVLEYREDLGAAPTVTYLDGDDNDPIISTTTGELEGYASLFTNPVATLVSGNAKQARIRLHDITEPTSGYIGHDAQINVTAKDVAENSGTVTITLRLGHGAADGGTTGAGAVTMDNTGAGATGGPARSRTETAAIGAADAGGATGVVFDPILNVIGVLNDIHNDSDTDDTTNGSGTSVE